MPKQYRVSNVTIVDLLRPHVKMLIAGGIAVIGEGVVNLLEPWPLKVVVDNVVKDQPLRHGWLNRLILSVAGTDKLAILKLAAISFLVIACVGAICSYVEKYVTTSVAQWVTHNLRRAVYAHIQKMSLAYHDRTADWRSSQPGNERYRLGAKFRCVRANECRSE